jgi:hypothetical protein
MIHNEEDKILGIRQFRCEHVDVVSGSLRIGDRRETEKTNKFVIGLHVMGVNSATVYVTINGLGFESPWGRNFPTNPQANTTPTRHHLDQRKCGALFQFPPPRLPVTL